MRMEEIETRGEARLDAIAARDGLPLAVETRGPVGGPRVLFAHGFGQSRHAWARAAESLAARLPYGPELRAGVTCLAAHGQSMLLLRVLGKKRLLPAVWASLTVLALAVSVGSPLYLHPLHKPFMIVQWANWILILLLSFGFMAMRPRHLQGEIVQPAEGASLRDPLPET